MFLPGEMFFSAALQHDPELIEDGVEQSVILASPTTLIALLRAVAYGWRQEQLAENAHEISVLGRELHDRLRVLRRALRRSAQGPRRRASRTYNRAVGSFESRVLPQARKFKELGAGGEEDIPKLEMLDRVPRQLASASHPLTTSSRAKKRSRTNSARSDKNSPRRRGVAEAICSRSEFSASPRLRGEVFEMKNPSVQEEIRSVGGNLRPRRQSAAGNRRAADPCGDRRRGRPACSRPRLRDRASRLVVGGGRRVGDRDRFLGGYAGGSPPQARGRRGAFRGSGSTPAAALRRGQFRSGRQRPGAGAPAQAGRILRRGAPGAASAGTGRRLGHASGDVLRGAQARFTDPISGEKVQPGSVPHQISDFIMAATRAGFRLDAISEHAPDERLAAAHPRAHKYVGWPMLVLLDLVADARAE